MSQARPKRPTPWLVVTPRQRRRYNRKYRTFVDVVVLHVMDHGGTGRPVRKPLLHNTKPPERGSFATHVAYRCGDPSCRVMHRMTRAEYLGVA